VEPFAEVLDDQTTLRGVKLCGGNCLSSFVTTNPDQTYELSFFYRWLTTVGTLELRLGGQLIHRLGAPDSLSDDFQSARVLVTDPALLSQFRQALEVCLVPEGPARVQVADLWFRQAPDANPPPVIAIGLLGGPTPVELAWPSDPSRTYQVQARASLAAGEWINLGPALPGTGLTLTVAPGIEAGQPEGFYRVVVTPTPTP
jgi:hypothetical protein